MRSKIGIIFWIEGFSGSGKTTISKNVLAEISRRFGKTIILSGDILRKFFDKNGYSKKDRTQNSHKFSKLLQLLAKQGLNIIYSAVCLNNSARKIYKKNIKNFFQIYIKSDVKKIIKLKKKKTYKNKKNILGIHIKPEYPKNYDIMIENNFKKTIRELSDELMKKIKKNKRLKLK